MITSDDKKQICTELNHFIDRIGTLKKATKRIDGGSIGTLSKLANYQWKGISDSMILNVGKQIGWSAQQEVWNLVETSTYRDLKEIADDAKRYGNVFCCIASAGSGKTRTVKTYANQNEDVYHIVCRDFWSRKDFLKEFLKELGMAFHGLAQNDMMELIIYALRKRYQPLVILDEFDKLPDHTFSFFITLYNLLEDECGVILMATDHLEKRMNSGLDHNKKGYQEIYSRMGRRFIHLDEPTQTDIINICMANGIDNKLTIKDIWDDCEGDIRRVKRRVHSEKKQIQEAAQIKETEQHG